MTLAPSGARGKYLALWIVSRNLGQLVGGAIKWVNTLAKVSVNEQFWLTFALCSLSKNYEKGVSGGVTPDTYIAFLIIECLAWVLRKPPGTWDILSLLYWIGYHSRCWSPLSNALSGLTVQRLSPRKLFPPKWKSSALQRPWLQNFLCFLRFGRFGHSFTRKPRPYHAHLKAKMLTNLKVVLGIHIWQPISPSALALSHRSSLLSFACESNVVK